MFHVRKSRLLPFLCLLLGTSMAGTALAGEPLPKEIRLKPVRTLPHDSGSFCQGLVFETSTDGTPFFYESTGLYGRSAIKKVSLADGKTFARENLSSSFFGEGAAVLGSRLYQITWREKICFVYDKSTLRLLEKIPYEGEGWGLTSDGTCLVMSDGSDRVVFRDPNGLKPIREIRVFWKNRKTGKQTPIPRLNELEWIEGEIWANIYETTKIARINPETGEAVQILDFARYVPKGYQRDPERVLNGIAWDGSARRLYITGKEWPVLYELEIASDPGKKEE